MSATADSATGAAAHRGDRSTLAATARVAWRGARHDRKRTMFVVALIAIPVAVAVVVGGVVEAGRIDPVRSATARMGQADLLVERDGAPSDAGDWTGSDLSEVMATPDVASAVTSWTPLAHTWMDVRLPGANQPVAGIDTWAYDPAAPETQGLHELRSGAWPGAGEVVITPLLADVLDVAVGDSFAVEDGAPTATVSGIIAHPFQLEARDVVAAPGELDTILPTDRPPVAPGVLVSSDDPEAAATAITAATSRPTQAPADEIPRRLHDLLMDRGWSDELVADLSAGEVDELLAMLDETAAAADVAVAAEGMVGANVDITTRATYIDGIVGNDELVDQPVAVGTLAAVVLLVEVALVAGAAYAAGIRRRLREIGLLSAQGATTTQVRRIVVGEAIAAGLVGAGLGVAVGVAAVIAGRPLVESFSGVSVTGIPLQVAAVVAPAAVGIVAAMVAAWLPARTASRVPTVTALQGRMPESAPPGWLTPAGVVATGVGTLLLVVGRQSSGGTNLAVAVIGVVLMIAGVALLSGPLVALVAKLADLLPPTPRMVLRDAARQRTRAAAAVAASMIVLVAPVGAATALAGQQVQADLGGLPDNDRHVVVSAYSRTGLMVEEAPASVGAEVEARPADEADGNPVQVPQALVEQVSSVLPDARHAPVVAHDVWVTAGDLDVAAELGLDDDELGGTTQRGTGVALATDELARALGTDRIVELVADGTPVLLGMADRPRRLDVARIFDDPEAAPPSGPVQVDAVEVPVAVSREMPRLLLDRATIDRLGLAPARTGSHLFVTPSPLTAQQAGRLDEAMATWRAEATDLDAYTDMDDGITRTQTLLIVLALTLAVMAVVIGMVTALAAAESRGQMRIVTAVGAAPAMRRRFLGLQTWVHVTLGAILAVPLGLLLMVATRDRWPTASLFGIHDGGIVVPWGTLGLLVVLGPALLGLATAVLVRSSRTQPPRRIA